MEHVREVCYAIAAFAFVHLYAQALGIATPKKLANFLKHPVVVVIVVYCAAVFSTTNLYVSAGVTGVYILVRLYLYFFTDNKPVTPAHCGALQDMIVGRRGMPIPLGESNATASASTSASSFGTLGPALTTSNE